VIHSDSNPPARPSTRARSGFQMPRVTELTRRWDPTQGREVFLSPPQRLVTARAR
jgi:hypothetical protein